MHKWTLNVTIYEEFPTGFVKVEPRLKSNNILEITAITNILLLRRNQFQVIELILNDFLLNWKNKIHNSDLLNLIFVYDRGMQRLNLF